MKPKKTKKSLFFEPDVDGMKGDLKKLVDEKSSKGKGKAEFISFEEGENIVRLLPPTTVDSKNLYMDVGEHWKICKDFMMTICDKVTFGNDCPACDVADTLYTQARQAPRGSKKSERIYDEGRKYAARKRVYYIAVDRDDPKPVPKIMPVSKELHLQILAEINSSGYKSPWDVNNGRDLVITRYGTDQKTTYTCKLVKKPSPVSKNEKRIASIAASIPDLVAYCKARIQPAKRMAKFVADAGIKVKAKKHAKDSEEE